MASRNAVIYIHGQGGNAAEAEHYKPLFPDCDVMGFDYKSQTPREAKEEFSKFFAALKEEYTEISIIANSIGAFFSMGALNDEGLKRAFFIYPVVNMEKLITDMMSWADVSEDDLCEKKEIETQFGQTLSWEYLSYVRETPVRWNVPTHILYAENDNLTSFETISDFRDKTDSTLTVMENGEHWFHTKEQMEFLDCWIKKYS